MWPQIKQVGLTYFTRRYVVWLGTLIAVMYIAIALSTSSSKSDAAGTIAGLIGPPIIFLTALLAQHAKLQFAHSRARLLPGFAPTHVAVLAGILLATVLIYPAFLAASMGPGLLGQTALAVAMAALFLWGMLLNRGLWAMVGLVVFFSAMPPWGRACWISESLAHQAAYGLILIGGWVAVAAWLIRLTQLHEEMDEYQLPVVWRPGRMSRAEGSEMRRAIARQVDRVVGFARVTDAWHDRIGGYHGGNLLRRIRLMRYGGDTWPVALRASFVGLATLTGLWLFAQFAIVNLNSLNRGSGAQRFDLFAISYFILFALPVPGGYVLHWLSRRRLVLAAESMRPLTRRQFVDGMLVAAAWNAAVWWLAMQTVILAAVWWLTAIVPTVAMVVTFLLLSLSISLLAYGTGLLVALSESMIARYAVLILGVNGMFGLAIAWWNIRQTAGDGLFAVVAVVLGCAGAALIRRGRQAWLNLEFGR